MLRRTSSRSETTSWPATVAAPLVGFASVHSMLIVVVLPAPFGPRKPNTSPGATSKSTPRTACTSSKCLVRPSTTIAGVAPLLDILVFCQDRVEGTTGVLHRFDRPLDLLLGPGVADLSGRARDIGDQPAQVVKPGLLLVA